MVFYYLHLEALINQVLLIYRNFEKVPEHIIAEWKGNFFCSGFTEDWQQWRGSLELGFAVYLGFINLGMRIFHCYLKADTKPSPATCILRNWHATCFWELTYGFIFSLSAAVPLRVVWRCRQSRWFPCNSVSSIDYQYCRICDAIGYGKESHHTLRLGSGSISLARCIWVCRTVTGWTLTSPGSCWGECPPAAWGGSERLSRPHQPPPGDTSTAQEDRLAGQHLSLWLAHGERVRPGRAAAQCLIYKASPLILPNTGITSKLISSFGLL